jgi:hypothetical protein
LPRASGNIPKKLRDQTLRVGALARKAPVTGS